MHEVGLCMIVKDEAHVIARCLQSVRPLIDYWTIVDTGSTDGTQDLIRELLDGVPGHLFERPWINFGHNRSEALELARPHARYTFVIDADEILEVPSGFVWGDLTADSVYLLHRGSTASDTTYWRGSLVANRLPWCYRGVLHEYLEAPGSSTIAHLAGPEVVGHFDGGRSQNITTREKYARDAAVLEQALVDEPDNARYQYYLARSYRDSDQIELAIEAYRRRARMGAFAEEVSDSLLWVARLLERQGADVPDVEAAYLQAWQARPQRAEALVDLARYSRCGGRFALGRMVAAQAVLIERPDDLLWVEEDVYRWRALDELAVAAFWVGRYTESLEACRRLLTEGHLPQEQRDRVVQNYAFAAEKLGLPKSAFEAVPRPRPQETLNTPA